MTKQAIVESECEELADRLRAKEEAISETVQELERRAVEDDAITAPLAAKARVRAETRREAASLLSARAAVMANMSDPSEPKDKSSITEPVGDREQLQELLEAVRAHWRAKYAGRPAELRVEPEDRALYEVSTRIRAEQEAGDLNG